MFHLTYIVTSKGQLLFEKDGRTTYKTMRDARLAMVNIAQTVYRNRIKLHGPGEVSYLVDNDHNCVREIKVGNKIHHIEINPA